MNRGDRSIVLPLPQRLHSNSSQTQQSNKGIVVAVAPSDGAETTDIDNMQQTDRRKTCNTFKKCEGSAADDAATATSKASSRRSRELCVASRESRAEGPRRQ